MTHSAYIDRWQRSPVWGPWAWEAAGMDGQELRGRTLLSYPALCLSVFLSVPLHPRMFHGHSLAALLANMQTPSLQRVSVVRNGASSLKTATVLVPVSSVQFCSVDQSCPTLHDPMDCSMPGFPVLHHLLELKLKSIESVMPSNHLILCRPLLLLPSIFPSIRVCFSESVLSIRWPKYWSFSFSISPSSDYSRLLSFSINWLNLLAVQRILKSLLQHHSSKAWLLWRSAFFIWSSSHIHTWLLENP